MLLSLYRCSERRSVYGVRRSHRHGAGRCNNSRIGSHYKVRFFFFFKYDNFIIISPQPTPPHHHVVVYVSSDVLSKLFVALVCCRTRFGHNNIIILCILYIYLGTIYYKILSHNTQGLCSMKTLL